MKQSENTAPTDSARAAIGRKTSACEQASATGRYWATCLLPSEADRPRVITLSRAISRIKRRLAWLPKLGDLLTRQLQASLAAIPMQTLWICQFPNLVTTQGRTFGLDAIFSGSSYTAAWYLGLISATSYTTGPAIGDTAAAHGGWVEDQNYSEATRQAMTFNSASAARKSLTTPIVFTIDMDTTAKGCAAWSSSTKGGTTGTLYSAGLFLEGDQELPAGALLRVSYEAGM